ncbi:TIGR02281 family clan AA aspartic protease [uncultured Erythrobacter sp.]|uniref:retropepsin-like aspartic protease family protein n=1 Tax=uncultured Erythrobacter sp. TaxID=263913 RepID=UPI00261F77EE|nr:TIGR02281 family clan AA aspartic protease [uncultured Erythrobacter sp.]
MIGRSLALTAGICLFAALVAGSFDGNGSPNGGDWVPRSAVAQSGTAGTSDWNAGTHTLSREYDGHFYASTTVNGASLRMLVDTGASVIALTGSDARAAGIYWDQSEVSPVARGASGTVYGVERQLEVVDVGGFTRRNVRAMIVPQGLDISLLGQSYLGQISSVQIEGNRMVLSGS